MLPHISSHDAWSSVSRTTRSTRATSALPSCGPGFVEVHREPVLVGDGEIRPDLVLDRHHRDAVPAFRQEPLQPLSRIAAGDEHGQRLAAEGVNHARRR